MINQTLNNRYLVTEKLAEGSTSVVYKARDEKDKKDVVLKIARESIRTNEHSSILRFTQQMRPLLSEQNPYIVNLYDIFRHEDFPVVVSEYVSGKTLLAHLKSQDAPDIDRAVRLMIDVLNGIDFLHSRNILHRDIKPSNVMLKEEEGKLTARVNDFGLAIIVDINRMPQEEEIAGTFSYMSPEQTGMLKKPLDFRSDIYSAGVLLYQMLTRRLPFSADSIPALIHKHIAQIPTTPGTLNSKISPVLDKVVMKMLAKDPQDRYQTEKGVIADLEEYLKQRGKGIGRVDFEVGRQDKLTQLTYQARLVGRKKEFQFLQSVIDNLQEGRGSVVFIAGKAGAGKTRLANELRGYAYTRNAIFCSGKCYKTSYTTPYAVMREALEDYIERIKHLPAELKQGHIQQMKKALGELGEEIEKITPKIKELLGEQPPLVELESSKERIRFLITAGKFLNSLATKENPVVVFLDDLQWADESSVEVLRETVKNIANSSLLFLITYREEEVEPENVTTKLMLDLADKKVPHHFLRVGDLTEDQTNEVISEMLSEKPEELKPLTKEIHARTQGNAFFITELLHTLINSEAVYFKEGHYVYDLGKIESLSLPDNVIDILLSRIETLTQETSHVLSFASVIGKKFHTEDVLGILSFIQPQQVLNCLEEATDKQFLTRNFALHEEILFVHDRVREAFYKKVPETERVELNKKIAYSLEERHKDNPEPVIFDLAYHFHEAGIEDKTLHYSIEAAHKAQKAYANAQAINLYLIVRGILEKQNKTDTPEYIAVLENMGEAYRLAAMFDESMEVLQLCESLIPREDRVHRAEVFSIISDTLWEKGDIEKCIEALEEGLAILRVRIAKSKTGILMGIMKEFPIQLAHMLFCGILVKKKYKTHQENDAIASLFTRLCYILYFSDIKKMFYIYLRLRNFLERKIGPSVTLMRVCRNGPPVFGTTTLPWFWKAHRDVQLALSLAQNMQDKVHEGLVRGYVAISLLFLNRPKEGVESAQKAIDMVKGAGEYWDLGVAYAFRDNNNPMAGRLKQGIAENQEMITVMETAGVLQCLGWALFEKGRLFSFIGEVSDGVMDDLRKSIDLVSQTRDKLIETEAWACLGFAHFRRKEYKQAQECMDTLRDYFPQNGLGCWALYSFPMGAEVYLGKLQDIRDLSEGERRKSLNQARWFCKQSMHWGKICKTFLGWSYQVNGTYAWLTGKKKKAIRLWEKGIRFLREHTEDKYRLARILLEEAKFIINEPDEKLKERARKYLEESRGLLLEMGCKQDLRSVNELLGIKEELETVEEQDTVITLAERERTVSLLEVSNLISSILDLDVLLEKILELSIKTSGAERGFLLLYSETTGKLRCALSHPRGMEERQLDFSKMKISRTVIAKVEENRQGLVYPAIDSQKQAIESTESVTIYGIRSIVCAPLVAKDKLLGMIYLDNHLAEGVFEKKDSDALTAICSQAAISIENARLFKESQERARLEQEMNTARQIQQSLLPDFSPQAGDLKAEGLMLSAKEVAGDFYDFMQFSPEKIGVVVADVSGKGLDSGMVMSMTKSSLITLSKQKLCPRELVVNLNKILCEQLHQQKFISLIYAEYTTEDNTFTWGGGGHEHVLVYRPSQEGSANVEVLKTGGIVLGMFDDVEDKIPQESMVLNKGDRIVLYSDGVTEARDKEDKMFTLQRLVESIKDAPAMPVKEFLAYLKEKIQNHIIDTVQYDDITLVVLGRE